MNFLQLCQRVRQETGIAGTGPTTVVGQTGELKRVVEWTANAARDIQARHNTWKFLRRGFTVDTVANTQFYLPTDCTDELNAVAITAAGFANWKEQTFRRYLKSAGVATEQFIWPMHWEAFRDYWMLRTLPASFPMSFGIRPRDQALGFGPIPDAVYTVHGDYVAVATDLAADADVPLLPTRFEMAIVWLAVRSFAGYQEAGGLFQYAQGNYDEINGRLEIDQLPGIEVPDALA